MRSFKCGFKLALVALSFVGVSSPAFARELSPEQVNVLQTNFAKADVNHDGQLTPQEVTAMPRIAPAFSKIDSDGDRLITLPQILAFIASH